MVWVVVTAGFDGDSLELEVLPDRDILHVKTVIARTWSVPQIFQKLVAGTAVVHNHDTVTRHAVDGRLRLNLIVSLDQACEDLQNQDFAFMRGSMLRDFGALGPKGGDAAVDAVSALLQDECWDIRKTAVTTLGCMAGIGDDRVISALMACLQDDVWQVIHAAIEALGRLSKKGDARIICALCACVRDVNARDDCRFVVVEALTVLGRIAVRSDERVLDLMDFCLSYSDDREVRWIATRSLIQTLDPGDTRIVNAMCRFLRLYEEDSSVAEVAMGALQELCHQHHAQHPQSEP